MGSHSKATWARRFGSVPGDLTDAIGSATTVARRVRYTGGTFSSAELSPDGLAALVDRAGAGEGVTWVDIAGEPSRAMLEAIGGGLGVSPLVLEDIQHPELISRVHQEVGAVTAIVQAVYWNEEISLPVTEQVSAILSDQLLVTVRGSYDWFAPVRERIRDGRGRVRSRDAGYLMYALLDCAVDSSLVSMERLRDHFEALQTRIFAVDGSPRALLREIGALQSAVTRVRRGVTGVPALVETMRSAAAAEGDTAMISYWNDLHDHATIVADSARSRTGDIPTLLGMLSAHHSTVMNQTMKTLTVISTVFIPITFIAGVYGMNFANMPELDWRFGYPVALGVMGLTALATLLFVRWRLRR